MAAKEFAFLHATALFTLEPLSSFRLLIKEKAVKQDVHNLFVMNVILDSKALPDDFLDILTSAP